MKKYPTVQAMRDELNLLDKTSKDKALAPRIRWTARRMAADIRAELKKMHV